MRRIALAILGVYLALVGAPGVLASSPGSGSGSGSGSDAGHDAASRSGAASQAGAVVRAGVAGTGSASVTTPEAVGSASPGPPAAAASALPAATATGSSGPGRPARALPRPVVPVPLPVGSPKFTVAAPVATGATIAGCPLFPADNAWRQDVSQAPVSPYSSAWVTNIGTATHLHPDFGSDPSYGIPYVVVPANQPKVAVNFTDYPDESDAGPYPVPANAPIESGGDAHVLVASADCHLYELYGASHSSSGWSASNGAIFNLNSDALRPAGWTSADAAGLPILPGLVRPDEIAAGHIDHALRFTVARTQKGYIAPATHQAGSTTDPNVVPMGARFRLKASFNLAPYHGAALIILTALKKYGMFVADNGSNWYLSGATYTGWNDDDLNQLKTLTGSAFEAVNTGAVQH